MKALTTLIVLSIISVAVALSRPAAQLSSEEVPQAVASWKTKSDSGASTATSSMDARQALIDRQRSDAPGIYGANSKDAAEIRRAFDLYAAADLTLPSLRIYVHSTNEGCNENDGLFNKDYTGHRIDVCDVRVLVHELAHAWEHNHMDETGRQAFMDYAGLEVWSDYDTRYAQRGVEQVAEVIASGVRDGQVSVEHLDLYHEHIHRYRMLTGKPSPRIAEAIGEMRRNRI